MDPQNTGKEVATKTEFGGVTLQQRAELAATAVSAAVKAEVESAYVMALKRPRNEDHSLAKIQNVCRNLSFAERAEYSKPIGGKTITGLSIRFAEEMNRHWGNIKVQQLIIYEDETRRIAQVVVIDLESNESYSKQIVVEKKVERKYAKGRDILGERLNTKNERVFIVVATEDEVITKEAALVSKAIRDCSLRLIPHHIKESAINIIHETVRSGVSKDPDAAKRTIIKNFSLLNIMPEKLEEFLGHSLDGVTQEEMIKLNRIFSSIKEGEARFQDFLSEDNKKQPETAKMPDGDPSDFFQPGDESKHQAVDGGLKDKK